MSLESEKSVDTSITETSGYSRRFWIGVALCGLALSILCVDWFVLSFTCVNSFHAFHFHQPRVNDPSSVAVLQQDPEPDRNRCHLTCELEVTESIPENVTFGNVALPRSTFDAWKLLIRSAKERIDIAAYKSSLRGKHVLNQPSDSAALGEQIFEELVSAARERSVDIRMIENFPAKDPGDNEDGKSLARRGVAKRRQLNYSQLFGAGAMHSKFLVVDGMHLYLGSANLDWRSLNQKMELGVFVRNCPCLAADLEKIFACYWTLTAGQNDTTVNDVDVQAMPSRCQHHTTINEHEPLVIRYRGALTSVYLASSPEYLNGPGRSRDLDAILTAIDTAERFVYVHVMDYIPMIVYREPHRYWPVIDDALRRAALDRGVEVKLLVAALHFMPQMLHFLKSLQSLNAAAHPGSIEVRIFKVPAVTQFHSTIARERRTHNKFLVTEGSAVIGTSNWSGDYFTATTGVAFVVAEQEMVGGKRPFIEQMKEIFWRDWQSEYAHTLATYMKLCLHQNNESICQEEKEVQAVHRTAT